MTPFRKILFATDFSTCSARAKELATEFKNTFGCHLDVVHVYDPSALVMPVPYNSLPGVDQWVDNHFDIFRKQGREALEALGAELGDGCSAVFLEGQPGPTLVEYAKAQSIDLMVIGTHGHRGFQRLLMGSVAEYLMHHAPCPVLVAKSDE